MCMNPVFVPASFISPCICCDTHCVWRCPYLSALLQLLHLRGVGELKRRPQFCACVCVCVCVQVLQKVDVVETLRIEKNEKLRLFKVSFQFLPPERYSDDKLLSPQKILHYMETRRVSVGGGCYRRIILLFGHISMVT